MNENTKDLSITTFNTVVILKDRLLDAIEANRNKHNALYDAAVSGYWIEAQKVLDKKGKDFEDAIEKTNKQFADQKTYIQNYITDQNKDKMSFSIGVGFYFDTSWPLKFPENHLEDYDRIISMLRFSVADKVELSAADFDSYVRNNWSWRKNFLSNNTAYAYNTLSGCAGALVACSGAASVTYTTGCYNLGSFTSAINNAF